MTTFDMDAQAVDQNPRVETQCVRGGHPHPISPEILFAAAPGHSGSCFVAFSIALPLAFQGSSVDLDLFDGRGQKVATLLRNRPVSYEPQRVNWSGRGEDGRPLTGDFEARLRTTRGVYTLKFKISTALTA